MPEMCRADPARECHSATRLALLEERVRSLELNQEKESEFRDAYYAEQRTRIHRDAGLDAKIDDISEKVGKLVRWQEEQQNRPARRWDGIVDKLVWAIVGAVAAFFLAKFGL